MAKQLVTASISAPGFYGLNTQDSSVTLNEGFALVTENCVIDQYGRLGARKGYEYVTDKVTHADVELKGGFEFTDILGVSTLIGWNDTTFYTSSNDTLTAITDNSSNTINEGDWVGVTLNDECFFYDKNYSPMQYVSGTNELVDLTDAPHGNIAISAYGRVWVANTTTDSLTLYWSDLLDGTNFSTGSAGSIDLAAILVNGGDEIVALGTQAGRLIVFCKDNVVVFSDNDGDTILDPINMRLVEVISGVGCVARDSVQNVGNDVLFLAEDGLRSLGRLVQEKGQPLSDLSKNIRDELVREISLSPDRLKIKSVYSQREAFYLLLIPAFNEIYCFDVREFLQNGAARATNWEEQHQTDMLMVGEELYFTHTHGFAKYTGYLDDESSYDFKYYTNYLDFGDATQQKEVKRMAVTVISAKNQNLTLRVGYDYTRISWFEEATALSYTSLAEWGTDEYGIAEFGTGDTIETIRAPMGGSGNIIQAGFEAVINGYALSIQRVDLYVKQGRVY